MIYITGDTHGEFSRFSKNHRVKLPFEITKDDYIIVCGDFGLLWAKDAEFEYYRDWLAQLPFTILWVSGNHENYNMIEEYPLEIWNGGKVRHIVRDKVILLERGQVFELEGKKFFTFGGASSHDIQGGILDRDDMDYREQRKKAEELGLPYRILNLSWWEQELPTEAELQEGRKNLEKAGYKVDYVISHCGSTRLQTRLDEYFGIRYGGATYDTNILTEYFNELEVTLDYKKWFCGHYHVDMEADEKHVILYFKIVPISVFEDPEFQLG